MEKKVSKFHEKFIKDCDEESNKGCILEVDVEHPKKLHNLHNDLSFLSERMKNNKFNKSACNLFDKEDYVINIRAL